MSPVSDRPVDPSALVNDDTPDDFDVEKVIEQWGDIEERGHPLGPAQYDGERSVDTGTDGSTEGSDDV